MREPGERWPTSSPLSRKRSYPWIALVAFFSLVVVGLQFVRDVPVPVTAETTPAHGRDDAADDPAIWVNREDPSKSLVLGTNKKRPRGGLQVFDLDGRERQFLAVGRLNNVDVRHDFPLSGKAGAVVGATDRDTGAVRFFTIDEDERMVQPRGVLESGRGGIYGFCLYHDGGDDSFYAVATFEDGLVRQYRLRADGDAVTGSVVRSFSLSSTAEGCVADDELGHLYVTQEEVGIWKLPARPDQRQEARLVDSTAGPRLEPDVEGVAIYDEGRGKGLLIVSSQGDNTFAAYDRAGENAYVGSFTLRGSGSVDRASGTDGLDVTSAELGPTFPSGLLVVHDQEDAGSSTSNFKLIDWRNVAGALQR